MAKPIAPTPTLSGKDATAILHELHNPEYSEEKRVFLQECKDAYELTK